MTAQSACYLTHRNRRQLNGYFYFSLTPPPCDRVFEHARRERKQEEWRDKMREALDRKRQQAERLRESIEHDEGNVSRRQDTIYNLRPGGRADEIRDDLESRISDVEHKIRSKRRRLDELEDSISDIEARLHR